MWCARTRCSDQVAATVTSTPAHTALLTAHHGHILHGLFFFAFFFSAQTQSPKVNADTTPAGSDVPIADDAGSGEASGLEDGFDFTYAPK